MKQAGSIIRTTLEYAAPAVVFSLAYFGNFSEYFVANQDGNDLAGAFYLLLTLAVFAAIPLGGYFIAYKSLDIGGRQLQVTQVYSNGIVALIAAALFMSTTEQYVAGLAGVAVLTVLWLRQLHRHGVPITGRKWYQ